MSEGRNYRCDWERTRGGYRVWVHNRRMLQARGPSLQVALDELSSVICVKTGDGEASFTLWPLAPANEPDRPWILPNWCSLFGAADVRIEGGGEGLFSGGWCSNCNEPIGKRTSARLRATRSAAGDACTPWWDWGMEGVSYHPLICSERLLSQFTSEEVAGCEWREVEMPKRCRTRMFECIPRRRVPEVAVKGWATEGWTCKLCGTKRFSCSPSGRISWSDGSILEWYSQPVLTRQGAMSRLGDCGSGRLLLDLVRGSQLLESGCARGLDISLVGGVKSTMVDPAPPLRTKKFASKSTAILGRKQQP